MKDWLTTAQADAQALAKSPDDTQKAQELAQLCDHAYRSVDKDGDQRVDAVPGEAGAITAYQDGQLITALSLTTPKKR